MLQTSHSLTRARPRPHICLGCRLQSQRRARHTASPHPDDAIGSYTLLAPRPGHGPPLEEASSTTAGAIGPDTVPAYFRRVMKDETEGNMDIALRCARTFHRATLLRQQRREISKARMLEKLERISDAVRVSQRKADGTRGKGKREEKAGGAFRIRPVSVCLASEEAARFEADAGARVEREAARMERAAAMRAKERGGVEAASGKLSDGLRTLEELERIPEAARVPQRGADGARGEGKREEGRKGASRMRRVRVRLASEEAALSEADATGRVEREAARMKRAAAMGAKQCGGMEAGRGKLGDGPRKIKPFEEAARSPPTIRRLFSTPFVARVEETKQIQLEDLLDEHTSALDWGRVGSSDTSAVAVAEGDGAWSLAFGVEHAQCAEAPRDATSIALERRRCDSPDKTLSLPADGADSQFSDALDTPAMPKQALGASYAALSSNLLRSRPSRLSRGLAWQQAPSASSPSQARAYRTSQHRLQQQAAVVVEMSGLPPELLSSPSQRPDNPNGIRAQLRRWQEVHGDEDRLLLNDNLGADVDTSDVSNNLTRLPENNDAAFRNTPAEQEEDEREATAQFTHGPSEEPNSSDINSRFLNMGDLVELEFNRSDTPNIVAVFVRRVAGLAQLYTMQGRWVHLMEKRVQYAIPGWVTEDMVTPLLQHLPGAEVMETSMDELLEQAYLKDMSVPREVAAPLVSRMLQFDAEAKEIYRKHASTLDNAHQLLAHETDLRYGSLVSTATTLLRTPADKLPVTALFAVRQALTNAGFAFSIDRRSHRVTGYLQIRSKEQVRMVEQVRGWLREWQDDLAMTATLSEEQRRKHRTKRGAAYVYNFVNKARAIIRKSREDRDPTVWGTLGPSKVRIPITPEQDCVRVTQQETFNAQDTELVRFIEGWSLSLLFKGLRRLIALPPLLLQATGMYENHELNAKTGMLMLQELGTILPYEDRLKFDSHLLLPSSQHSKPLQNLMSSLLDMSTNHDLKDSMAELRHDWGSMPVFCIDDASAHEIDDGFSIEPAAGGTDGPREWWVHVHIANPTAFFERNHPLAKMARHMGESIYMPERAYMMLPRWSTQRHFSLGSNRPCLTFSARLDAKGRMLEHKIRSGIIRRVLRLTPKEVAVVLEKAEEMKEEHPEITLIVGGEVPPERQGKSALSDVTPAMADQLKMLHRLSEQRRGVRRAAGGLFFETNRPEIKVWQSHKAPGLAWDQPFRKGWRRVEGDPVIQMKTRRFVNWFTPAKDPVRPLVTEMMLLASEVAATWCKARAIPAVFRGSVRHPDRMPSDQFLQEVLLPAAAKDPKGETPMHIGLRYLETFGSTALSTSPFKHKIVGLDAYGKVTSPLRRYGDMILHWQIEAALREEARTGRSLVTDKKVEDVDRRFLPFSANVLNTIIVGLQPREKMISRSKSYSEMFWISQLLFRAHHFGETALPFGKTLRAYVHDDFSGHATFGWGLGCFIMDLNVTGTLMQEVGSQQVTAKMGDVWECEIEQVDCYKRVVILKAVRLLERAEDGPG